MPRHFKRECLPFIIRLPIIQTEKGRNRHLNLLLPLVMTYLRRIRLSYASTNYIVMNASFSCFSYTIKLQNYTIYRLSIRNSRSIPELPRAPALNASQRQLKLWSSLVQVLLRLNHFLPFSCLLAWHMKGTSAGIRHLLLQGVQSLLREILTLGLMP